MAYEMPPVPRKYQPAAIDTPQQAAIRAAAREQWIAEREAEIAAGQEPQKF